MINRKITLVILYLFLLFNSFYFYQVPYVVSVNRLTFIVGVVCFVYILFFLTKEENRRVKRQYLSLSRFFIIGYTIVFFQNYIDLLLGFTDWDHYLSVAYPKAVCKSALISLSGFICFCIGYLLYRNNRYRKRQSKKEYTPLKIIKLLTLVTFIIYINSMDRNYINGGYGEVEIAGTVGFIGYFLEALLYGVIILYSINCSSNTMKDIGIISYIRGLGWFNAVLGAYLFMVLLSGDRGAILFFLLAYSYSYICYSKRTVSGKTIFVLILIGGFIFTILGIARNVQDFKGNKLEQIDIALQIVGEKEKTSFFLPTKELANSVRTLHAAVESSVTQRNPYFYGKYQLYQILSSLPFMGTVLLESGMYTKDSSHSSDYITFLLQGDSPNYGDGTSCNAELFLDFGYWGVCIGLFLFGLFCRETDVMECEHRSTSLFFYILMIVYFSYCIGLARDSILFPFKRAVLVYLICIIYKYFIKYFSTNKS